MTDQSIIRRQKHAKAFACAAGCFVIVLSAFVLMGWWARIEALKRVSEGMISMNPMTAVCLGLSGLSLVLQLRGSSLLARVLATIVVSVGILKLIGYCAGWSLPVDQLLFTAELHLNEPGLASRIAPNTALGLVLLGLGLLSLDHGGDRMLPAAELLAMGVAFIASLGIVGYIYQVEWLFGVASHVPMAVHTAASLLMLAVALACARPDRGLMEVVTGDSTGGLLARHLFPCLALVFTLAGSLKLMGESRGVFQAGQGEAVYTVMSIGLFGGFVLWVARRMHKADMERLRVERERESFYSLSLELFGIAGMDGYFKSVNPAFCKTLGYSEEEILARSYFDFIHPDDREATAKEGETLRMGVPTIRFENRYRCRDGSWIWLEWSTRPLVNEGILHAVARDVTEKKRVETEIKQQAVHLEALNSELEAFSYSVSHDLRAPLRGISGFARALEEHAADRLDQTGLAYLQRIRRAAGFMGELIDDLLRLSRLTRAEMSVESVNLSEMAHEIIEEFRLADPERVVEAVIEPDIIVSGDGSLLRAMLDNLLSNSWKFTSGNPQAVIEFGKGSVENGMLWCHVRDNGVGFDNRYAHKLFGAFQRLHSQNEFKGTGIGLATVRRIIRRHGGEITGEGEIDKGAIFRFSIKAADNATNP